MTDDLIDLETFEAMKSMTDEEFLASLIDVYLTDSPDLIQQMHTGLESGDIELVRRAAHSLKSSSASLGANRLAESARELEMLAKKGTLNGGQALLSVIESNYAQVAPVLTGLK